MATTWISFKQIKAEVAIESVLARYGVRLRRVGGELRGACPLPTHSSRRSRDSFSVNPARQAWSCRSQSCMAARGGAPGGGLLDLVALLERCSIRDAALRLHAWSGRGLVSPRPVGVPNDDAARTAPNRPLSFALQYIDGHHPYLARRGLASETIRRFGMGFYGGHGILRGRIVIPIHDAQGALVAYAGRAVGDETPKYRFPTGFRKSLVLFNLHRVLPTGARTVVVVEGFFDACAVHQAGIPAVVALMGSTLSRHQADLLATRFDRVILVLDGDDAGRQGTTAITAALTGRLAVEARTLAPGVQPDQLAPPALARLVTESSHA